MLSKKWKIGDVLVIKGNKSDHEFKIGEEVKVTDLCYDEKKPNIEVTLLNGDDKFLTYWFIYNDSDIKYKK